MNRNKRRVIIAAALGLMALGAFGLGRNFRAPVTRARAQAANAARVKAPPVQPMPEHAPYEFLFRRIQLFTDKKMPEPQLTALLQKELGIDAGRVEKLKQIALGCLGEVRQQDARAEVVIEQVRARYPDKKIRKGQPLPGESPELVAMQRERDAVFLRARASLQTLFGEKGFGSFDEKVKAKLDYSRVPARASAR